MAITPSSEIWIIMFIFATGLGAYILGTLMPYALKSNIPSLKPFLYLIFSIIFGNISYGFAVLFVDLGKKYIAILGSFLVIPVMIYFWVEFSILYALRNEHSKYIKFFKYLVFFYMLSYVFIILLDPWKHTILNSIDPIYFEHGTTLLYLFFDSFSYIISAFGALFIIIGLLRKKVRPIHARLLLFVFLTIFIGSFLASKRILGNFDFSPIVLIVALFIISIWMHKIDVFPFTVRAQEYLLNAIDDAIALLDDETRPLIYNKNTLMYFPELKGNRKLKDLTNKLNLFDLKEYFQNRSNLKYKRDFKLGGFTHNIEISPISYGKYLIGYVVVIYDITKEIFLRERLEELNATLEERVREREKEIERIYKRREEELYNMIRSLVDLIDLRDNSTGGHSRRIVYYSYEIAEALGLPKEEIKRIALAASLHDIGKIGIPDDILKKPSGLTDEEYEIIKSHARVGRELLRRSNVFSDLAEMVGEHHERWDGNGYPDGKKGDEISIGGQILAVADAFEAMTADRVYRRAMKVDVALSILEKERGKQFSPKVVDIFIDLVRSGKIEAPYNLNRENCAYLSSI